MQKDVSFFGMKFTQLQFILFFFGWMFFLAFIWPFIIGSYLGMSVLICGISILFVGLLNRLFGLPLLVFYFVNKSLIRYYQNFMMVLTSLLATWIYSFFVPMNFYTYMAHLLVNTFTVFLIHDFFFKKGDIEDEIISLDDDN